MYNDVIYRDVQASWTQDFLGYGTIADYVHQITMAASLNLTDVITQCASSVGYSQTYEVNAGFSVQENVTTGDYICAYQQGGNAAGDYRKVETGVGCSFGWTEVQFF